MPLLACGNRPPAAAPERSSTPKFSFVTPCRAFRWYSLALACCVVKAGPSGRWIGAARLADLIDQGLLRRVPVLDVATLAHAVEFVDQLARRRRVMFVCR